MKVSKNRNNIFRDFLGCQFSKLTHNVCSKNAVCFAAMNDQFSRAKSNGATTLIHIK